MNWLFKINDSLANKISYYHLLLLMASLPFDMFYSHIILISFAIHTLIHLNKNTIKPIFTVGTLILQSVFFITVLSTIYSINKPAAFDEWGKHIVIFLFPLLFCLNPLDLKKYRPRLLTAFALVCTATVIYLYFDAIIVIKHYQLPFKTLFSDAFTNHNFSEPIAMHATFFSMQLAVALVYVLSVLVNETILYKKLFFLICSAILTAGLIQLSSKSVFAALIIAVNVALPYFLLTGARRIKYIVAAVFVTALAVVVIFNSNAFRKRYITELRQDISKQTGVGSTDSRLARWNVATGLIVKAPILGYGAGSEMGLLHEAFFKNKLYNSYLNGLNAHNQYLSFLIKSGIVGLLVYLATLAFGFKISFRQKDTLFFTFMALIAIVSLSEDFLDVDKGTFFYAFFFSFFVFSNEAKSRGFLRAEQPKALIKEKNESFRPEVEDLPLAR
jgi:O-antigen ligase